MTKRESANLAWAPLALLFLLLQCHQWYSPDIWYHLYLGNRILETGLAQPPDHLVLHQAGYVNTYWLFQVAIAAVYGLGGIPLVTVLLAALWTGALLLWGKAAGLAWKEPGSLVLGFAAVLISQTRFEERPEVVSFLLLAVEIFWLSRWDSAAPARPGDYLRFALVQVLWSNVHGYFFLGPILVALKFACAKREFRRGLALLLLLTVLATLATPFGTDNWREVVRLARFFRAMHYRIQEFLPPARVPVHLWGIDAFEAWWWATVAALVWMGSRANTRQCRVSARDLFAISCAVLGLIASALSYRNLPFLVFLTAPLILAVRPLIPPLRLPRTAVAIPIGVLCLVLSASVVTGRFHRAAGGIPAFGLGESAYSYPVDFSAYLRRHPFGGLVFNDPGDGGYLEFHFPHLRLYGDSRFVDPSLILGYFNAVSDPASFRSAIGLVQADAVLLRVADSPEVILSCLKDPAWVLAYADLHRAFFIRRPAAEAAPGSVVSPRLREGESLEVPVNAGAATAWIKILTAAGDRAGLAAALRQFSSAGGK